MELNFLYLAVVSTEDTYGREAVGEFLALTESTPICIAQHLFINSHDSYNTKTVVEVCILLINKG